MVNKGSDSLLLRWCTWVVVNGVLTRNVEEGVGIAASPPFICSAGCFFSCILTSSPSSSPLTLLPPPHHGPGGQAHTRSLALHLSDFWNGWWRVVCCLATVVATATPRRTAAFACRWGEMKLIKGGIGRKKVRDEVRGWRTWEKKGDARQRC